MADLALGAGRIFDGERMWENRLLVLRDGAVFDIATEPPAGAEIRLLPAGSLLAPGFIDIQVNGGGGVMFNDRPDADGIRAIGAAHRKYGTTGFLPTLITDTPDKLVAALAAVETGLAEGIPGLLGIHVEGPFISLEKRGVHSAESVRALAEAELGLLTGPRSGALLLTLAPERVPADIIARLAAAGVLVAIGHTGADYETCRAAIAAGATGATHLFNAMTPLGSREPGAVGALLSSDGVWCGLIVDGFHVHPASLAVAVRSLPPGKAVLVTDAMATVGAEEQSFMLYGERIHAVNGRCARADGTLAGSALDMASAVRNAIRLMGIEETEALRMAARYPAEFLGVERRGRLTPGAAADVVALTPDWRVIATWIDGA